MLNLFDMLAARFSTDIASAAALQISRQAFSQAKARRRLSESATIRAAAILGIPAADALLINHTAGRELSPPVSPPRPDLTDDIANDKGVNNTNYAFFDCIKNAGNPAVVTQHVHSLISKTQAEALDLIKWVYAVAGLRADSPRFNYYVSRWEVPRKIARAKANGTFDEITRNCPPIDPAWVRLVPAALDECARYEAAISAPRRTTRASSGTKAKRRNNAPLAA